MGNTGQQIAYLNLERTDLDDAPADMSPELAAFTAPAANMAAAPEPERAVPAGTGVEHAVAVR